MKIKWLYKIPLVTAASALVSPMIVSCSVEKPKVETAEEKEKRLEHQRALQIAPNLTKFMKEYNNKLEWGKVEYVVRNIKELKEHTANINHLNDFEKSYLGLYEDIQNFFDNSIHRYTPENLSIEYFENEKDDSDTKQFTPFLKLEENTLTQEQMFYHKVYQVIKQYYNEEYSLNDLKLKTGNKIKFLENNLTSIINEKIADFAGNHKDFQFKNSKLTFREAKGNIIVEVALEVEYQNQKLPKEIVIPLSFDINMKTFINNAVKLEKDTIEDQKWYKEDVNKTMKKVKTFAEMENILKSKDNEYNRERLEEIKKEYDATMKIVENDKEVEM